MRDLGRKLYQLEEIVMGLPKVTMESFNARVKALLAESDESLLRMLEESNERAWAKNPAHYRALGFLLESRDILDGRQQNAVDAIREEVERQMKESD